MDTVSQALCSLLLKTDCRSARLSAKASMLKINDYPIHSLFLFIFYKSIWAVQRLIAINRIQNKSLCLYIHSPKGLLGTPVQFLINAII